MTITSVLLIVLSLLHMAVIVVSHDHDHDHHHPHHHHHHDRHAKEETVTKCGTESPNKALVALDGARGNLLKTKKKHGVRRSQAESCEDVCKKCIEIPVYVHFMQFAGEDFGLDFDFIPHPSGNVMLLVDFNDTSLTADDFTSVEDMLLLVDEQITMMNQYYANTPFFFTQMERDNISITVNSDWARYAQDDAFAMSEALNRGSLNTLNLYFGGGVDSREGAEAGTTIVAFARFPAWQMEGFSDGIYQRYDTLPGGGFPLNDIGMTTIHETGHWLGLYHTFQNANPEADPCSPSNTGDIIGDTPVQASDTQAIIADCTIFLGPDPEPFPDSCPDLPGLDPVFNFMNYVNDEACQVDNGEFTCQQVERMNWQWQLYRDGEQVCDAAEMEFGVAIQFEEKPEGQQVWTDNFLLVSAEGSVIFNSTTDYDSTFTAFGAPIAVALCVQNGDYAFIYNDGEGDGFALDDTAFIEVYQNGESIARITGDFGPQAIVEISQVPGVPTLSPVAAPTTPAPSSIIPPAQPPSPVPPRVAPPHRRPLPGKGKGGNPAKGKGKGYYYHSHGKGKGGHYHAHGHHHPGNNIFQSMTPRNSGYMRNGFYYRYHSGMKSSMMKSHYYYGGHGNGQPYGYGKGMGGGGGGYYQRPPRGNFGWW